MRFRLLHVRPHVWFYKQQQNEYNYNGSGKSSPSLPPPPPAAAASATESTTASDRRAAAVLVYRRSTSLRLLKEGPSCSAAENVRENPTYEKSKPPSAAKTGDEPQIALIKKEKEIQVCTVVDAGCTCRATVTSQGSKHKKAPAPLQNCAAPSTLTSHNRQHSTWHRKLVSVKRCARSGQSASTAGSVVSRLVCKSAEDVVEVRAKSQKQQDVRRNSRQGRLIDEGSKKTETAIMPMKSQLNVSSKRSYEDNHDSSRSCTGFNTSSLLNGSSANTGVPQRDLCSVPWNDVASTETTCDSCSAASCCDHGATHDKDMSLAELRASIQQQKQLIRSAQQQQQCSTREDSEALTHVCLQELEVKGRSASPAAAHTTASSPERMNCGKDSMCCCSSQECVQQLEEKAESVLDRHPVDEDDTTSTNKEEGKKANKKALHRERRQSRVARRPRLSGPDGSNPESMIAVASEEQHWIDGSVMPMQLLLPHAPDRSAQSARHAAEPHVDNREMGMEAIWATSSDDDDGDGAAERPSSAPQLREIQVLSEYDAYNINSNSNDNRHTAPSSSSSSSSTSSLMHMMLGGEDAANDDDNRSVAGRAKTETCYDGGGMVMKETGALAMVKSSYDPHRDFKESMVEMVVAKRINGRRQLQQLLQCYLSLNADEYHPTIVKAFHELCAQLFHHPLIMSCSSSSLLDN